MSDSTTRATAALMVCPNCGKPTDRSHFIDAERIGIAWSCQSIHPRKDGTCGRDYTSLGGITILPCRRKFGHRGRCGEADGTY